jgi:quinol monooxygenase YgiN
VGTEISWVFEAAVKADAVNEYGVLAREISADNRAAEPGQQIFEWFIDGQDVHIYERYQDSAAALAHVQRFVANFASRFLSLCTPTRMSVYGDPSDELKVAITGFNPRYLEPLAGQARANLFPSTFPDT